jgi:hypothetical protein
MQELNPALIEATLHRLQAKACQVFGRLLSEIFRTYLARKVESAMPLLCIQEQWHSNDRL